MSVSQIMLTKIFVFHAQQRLQRDDKSFSFFIVDIVFHNKVFIVQTELNNLSYEYDIKPHF